ncbi:hypothetical protein KR222_003697 [Zaprionus bogoriensis]|nr:hypothetical protein KR222_003697 [Zaprionus bogoriensis]
MLPHLIDEDTVDLEEVGVPDTFRTYELNRMCNRQSVRSCVFDHPNKVIERSSLCAVQLPEIVKEMSLTDKYRYANRLSEVQLEALTYACQAHEQLLVSGQRAGFLLGDGPGMGKGRILAAIIFENFKQNRKRALWISMSEDVIDVERDVTHIGAAMHMKVAPLSRFGYGHIYVSDKNAKANFAKGIVCCSYAELIATPPEAGNPFNSHVTQLVEWLGSYGVIVMDECHKANILSLTNADKFIKMCTVMLELQQQLPMARVVYASATGAAEPRNMVYMSRLGLWGEGTTYSAFLEFVNAMEKRGSGAMELIAADMKMRGIYLARHLSYENVHFRIEVATMTREFRKFYNYSADLWAKIYEQLNKACRRMCIDCRSQDRITRKFWSAHTRFFKNLCVAAKQKRVVLLAKEAVANEKAVIIGLHSTGECATLEHLEGKTAKLTNFVSTARTIIQSFLDNYFPAPTNEYFEKLVKDNAFYPEPVSHPLGLKRARMSSDWSDEDTEEEEENEDNETKNIPKFRRKRRRPPTKGDFKINFDLFNPMAAKVTESEVSRCVSAREKFLLKINELGRRMPPNTLDKLIFELGGSERVAEMTRRRGRLLKANEETYQYEVRGRTDAMLDQENSRERQNFLSNRKHVAIITEAATCGMSLHSGADAVNQRTRQHICMELPWSVERAIQQLGRTNRSNQENEPEYVILISDLASENYLASMMAKHLKNLGAIESLASEHSASPDLLFNFHTSIGCSALDSVLQQISGKKSLENELVPDAYDGDFLQDSCDALSGVGILNLGLNDVGQRTYLFESGCVNITTFLNRILGCRIEIQNAIFQFFLNKLNSLILQTRRVGHFDLGIIDLDVHESVIRTTKHINFRRQYGSGTASTELRTIIVERGMSFQAAMAEYDKDEREKYEGFYILEQPLNEKNCAILCLSEDYELNPDDIQITTDSSKVQLRICRPHTGFQLHTESLISISGRYVKTSPSIARPLWEEQFEKCMGSCAHAYWNSKCAYGKKCGLGMRVRTYHVLSGLMECIWERISQIIEKNGRQMQMVRYSLDAKRKIVGVVVPEMVYRRIVADLSQDSMVETTDYT